MFGYLVCRLRGHRDRWLLNLVNPTFSLMQESLWQCQRCGRTEKRGGWEPEPIVTVPPAPLATLPIGPEVETLPADGSGVTTA